MRAQANEGEGLALAGDHVSASIVASKFDTNGPGLVPPGERALPWANIACGESVEEGQ